MESEVVPEENIEGDNRNRQDIICSYWDICNIQLLFRHTPGKFSFDVGQRKDSFPVSAWPGIRTYGNWHLFIDCLMYCRPDWNDRKTWNLKKKKTDNKCDIQCMFSMIDIHSLKPLSSSRETACLSRQKDKITEKGLRQILESVDFWLTFLFNEIQQT